MLPDADIAFTLTLRNEGRARVIRVPVGMTAGELEDHLHAVWYPYGWRISR